MNIEDYCRTMLVPKINIDIDTFPIVSVAQYNRLLWTLPQPYRGSQYEPIYPKTNLLWPAIGIDAHEFRPTIGPIGIRYGGIVQGIRNWTVHKYVAV